MRRLSDDELIGASDHLFYEMDMLRGTAEVLAKGGKLQTLIGNALLESFLIHLRGLIEFLYDSPTHPDDVMASDYFAEGEWLRIVPPKSATLREALTRANKELAHITTFRIGKTLQEKQWPFVALAAEVFGLLETFIDSVAPERMQAGYKETFGNVRLRVTVVSAVAHSGGRST